MNQNKILSRQWQENEAVRRFQLIAPLLQPDLDTAKKVQLRRQLAEANGISERSIYRYEKAYENGQFVGLMPADRKKQYSQQLPENFESLLEEAIQLRKEVPNRSVSQIISILELEGIARPGVLKRSTLERHLFNAGFGSEHMLAYRQARESSSKRFCKPHRMMLVQADIKYGPKLPIGKNGAKVQTYLSSIIDDHSRFLLHSQFYDNQEEGIIEDSFKQAILRYGSFDRAYVDNGKQYVAKQLRQSLTRLGISISFARPRSGKSKGKVEKFHQMVDVFLREAALKPAATLEQLNNQWIVFLESYYHKKPHEGIREYYESLGSTLSEEGISPLTEFNRDSRPLHYLDTAIVTEAFLHHEERKVDKGACISFHGRRYEVRSELIGQYVGIAYDPMAPEEVTVSHPQCGSFQIKPLSIPEYCDQKPALPAGMREQKPATSRFLDALERKHTETAQHKADAISFSGYRKEGDRHV